MEKSGFFNSINGDRKYKADFFAEFFASFIGNGVYPNPSTSLQVLSNNDMTVTIKQGRAWINGRYYNNDSDLVLSLDIADGVLDRIDRIVIRKDTVKRKTYAYIKKGYFASSPPAPTLQRDADAYELGIADIYVKAGTISITQADITDLRLNKDLCGIVHGVVEQVDTTTLFNQYTERFKIKSEEFEKEFEDWLKTLKDVLDEDTAGNLLNLITKNEGNINNIKSELAEIATEVENNDKDIKFLNIIKRNISIKTIGWVKDSTLELYKYKIQDADITENTIVDVNIKISDLEKASNFKSSNQSFNGYVEIYSDEAPKESIICDLKLVRQVL